MQPDINRQDSLAARYAALGAAGTRFRIYAPPGVQRHGEQAGTLGDFVAAASSRCLFAGYRYESPLAGFDEWSWAPPPASPQMTVTSRQGGMNFAGQYYTLFRHYDPVLMRFTSPDPIASPFFNLHHYAGNNPAGAYDPDGLSEVSEYWGNWLRRQGQDEIDEMRASGQHTRAGVNIGIRNFIAGGADLLFGVIHGGYDFTTWLTTGEEMSLTKTSSGLSQRWEARQETISQSGASKPAQVSAFVVLSFGDLIGATQLFVEGGAGVNSVNGRQMTVEERATASTEGGLIVFSFASGTRRGPTEGGPYSKLQIKYHWDRHHMPAKEGTPALKHDGPAIRMRTKDHVRTSSHGRQGPNARNYRAMHRDMIAQGKLREAQALDIREIRQKFGGRYDRGIAEMLRYTDLYLKGKGHRWNTWTTNPSGGPRLPILPYQE